MRPDQQHRLATDESGKQHRLDRLHAVDAESRQWRCGCFHRIGRQRFPPGGNRPRHPRFAGFVSLAAQASACPKQVSHLCYGRVVNCASLLLLISEPHRPQWDGCGTLAAKPGCRSGRRASPLTLLVMQYSSAPTYRPLESHIGSRETYERLLYRLSLRREMKNQISSTIPTTGV